MNKKELYAIAKAIRENTDYNNDSAGAEEYLIDRHALVCALSEAFYKDNPSFNPLQFAIACGIER